MITFIGTNHIYFYQPNTNSYVKNYTYSNHSILEINNVLKNEGNIFYYILVLQDSITNNYYIKYLKRENNDFIDNGEASLEIEPYNNIEISY